MDSYNFRGDSPIKSVEDDRYSRKHLATALAKSLAGWESKESGLVVALYGTWGSGKTSAKNMTIQMLKLEHADSFVVWEFCPWRWESKDFLETSLITEIAMAIGQADSSKEIAKLFLLSGYLAQGVGGAVDIYGKVWSLLGNPAGKQISEIADMITRIGKTSKSFSEYFRKDDALLKESYESLRSKLSVKIRSLNKKVLIIIDDIDRLTSEEIRTVFRTIKTHSDLPNVAFLIPCQRAVVEHSLAELMAKGLDDINPIGRQFLDKIVHVGITLPELTTKNISGILCNQIDELAKNNSCALNSKELKDDVDLMTRYIQTPRQINRFITSLSFYCVLLAKDGNLQVNILDLALLEVLRTFEPDAFNYLNLHYESIQNHAVDVLQNLNILTRENNRHTISKILKRLFPLLGSRQVQLDTENAEKRISSLSVSFNYFRLVPA